MDKQDVKNILEQVKSGDCTVDEAVLKLRMEPFKDLGFAKVDGHRGLRQLPMAPGRPRSRSGT